METSRTTRPGEYNDHTPCAGCNQRATTIASVSLLTGHRAWPLCDQCAILTAQAFDNIRTVPRTTPEAA